jgi:hypothetical protein
MNAAYNFKHSAFPAAVASDDEVQRCFFNFYIDPLRAKSDCLAYLNHTSLTSTAQSICLTAVSAQLTPVLFKPRLY